VIIQLRNSEAWLIEYGVGVITIWRYEGKVVLIKWGELFAGVGSEIILPDDDEEIHRRSALNCSGRRYLEF